MGGQPTGPSPVAASQVPSVADGPENGHSVSGSNLSDPPQKLRSTRASRAWARILPAVVCLAIIIVFICQNLHSARVHFITLSGALPIGVALLAAAACGGLFVLALGSARILQLKKVIRHNEKRK